MTIELDTEFVYFSSNVMINDVLAFMKSANVSADSYMFTYKQGTGFVLARYNNSIWDIPDDMLLAFQNMTSFGVHMKSPIPVPASTLTVRGNILHLPRTEQQSRGKVWITMPYQRKISITCLNITALADGDDLTDFKPRGVYFRYNNNSWTSDFGALVCTYEQKNCMLEPAHAYELDRIRTGGQ